MPDQRTSNPAAEAVWGILNGNDEWHGGDSATSARKSFERIWEIGKMIAADGSIEGWGHHDVYAIVLVEDGQVAWDGYWSLSGGGCSCGGVTTVEGPFLTFEEARADLGDRGRSLVPGKFTVTT